ncbi:hypothetical protein QJS04_geneDACA017252 [Acorus gramineus]|uniref:CHHC U11-48K-type domain-containing protein n=1 Tax=Acorus gramineus TaxID=55184 RepID=A0AAV8ZYU9_ACOGR|nr:hypothetical protein QJS04_geneDACA017252 [Acorus gramineus]
MSAPHQPPHPSFTFLPQLPAPTNPNPNPPPPPPDLPTTISTLHTLLSSAEDTITSISKFFSLKTLELDEDEDDSVACPFDPRHRTPPESVFHHSLRCHSSPPLPLDLDLLFASLRYWKTLRSQAELARDNRFVGIPPGSDLCFSINTDYEENPCFSSGFFYRDCPGVVTFAGTSLRDSSTDDRTFVLPATLSGECSNFSDGLGCSPERRVGILPSELWALRREVGAWADYPVSYSYVVLRVASCLRWARMSGLRRWVILNSLRYGVLIDPAMRDHIFLLLNLCLRVIWREAFCSLEVVCGRDLSAGDGFVDPKGLRFECPQLVTALVWFTSQMDVLYGESNGKFFVIDMFKQSLFQAGSDVLLNPLAEKTRAWTLEEVDVGRKSSGDVDSKISNGMILEGSSEHSSIKGKNLCEDEIVGSSQVFVSQVAMAVAALHERSFLEQQIKELHFAQPQPKSQLINNYITMKANEERGKRSNYRAILEHDGLVWQQPRNQGPNTFKTREEQLAAERDYKRRRMSYRGKKVKRTQIDVLRDIIEEHMEEIKQAGGIGCFVKGATGTGMFLPESTFGSDMTSTFYGLKNSGHESSEVERKDSHVDGKMLCGGCDVMSVLPDDSLCQDCSSLNNGFENAHQQQGDGFHSPRGGQGRTSKYGQHIEHESRSNLSYQIHSHSHWPYDKKERHSMETTMVRKDSSVSSHRSMYQNFRSSSTSNEVNDCNKGNFDQRLENKSRHRRRNEGHKSGPSDSEHGFEDRYNPGSFEKCKDTR